MKEGREKGGEERKRRESCARESVSLSHNLPCPLSSFPFPPVSLPCLDQRDGGLTTTLPRRQTERERAMGTATTTPPAAAVSAREEACAGGDIAREGGRREVRKGLSAPWRLCSEGGRSVGCLAPVPSPSILGRLGRRQRCERQRARATVATATKGENERESGVEANMTATRSLASRRALTMMERAGGRNAGAGARSLRERLWSLRTEGGRGSERARCSHSPPGAARAFARPLP